MSIKGEQSADGGDISARHRALAQALQRRLMANVAAGETDHADCVMTNDATAYTDPHWLAQERAHLFRSRPLVAALSSDLPKPGDRILFDDAGPPILVVRGADQQVRAFFNICPHRAARLVGDCGSGARITCPFHGWTFNLQGQLVGQPGRVSFEDIDRAILGLQPVPVAEWNGLIFVIARAGDEVIDIADYLGELAPEMADMQLEGARFVKRTRLDAHANWKYVLDTFGEGYHVNVLHPDTVGRFVLFDSVIYDGFGPHHRMSFAGRSMIEDARKPPEQWPEAQLRLIYLLFPNTLIQRTPLGDGYNLIIYRIFPGERPDESFTLLETYRSGTADDVNMQPWIDAHDFQVSVVGGEDYPMAETAQRGLAHVPPDWQLVYGRNELSLQRFQRHVAEAIGRPLD
ncbi:MAG: aromatic ring-hydroxylating dioxygenase subunit alpha [Alphaproteobacteria bacterium]|nr:aromatic ring-hydroxylating dioxygenase subunit alpha [Alphaproteobacteria bacterium]